jgi:hypothetical protein
MNVFSSVGARFIHQISYLPVIKLPSFSSVTCHTRDNFSPEFPFSAFTQLWRLLHSPNTLPDFHQTALSALRQITIAVIHQMFCQSVT